MFRDRRDAGEQLARALRAYAHRPDVTVVGIPRGGAPVARAVADALGVPMDVLVVRKVRSPLYPDVVLGAVAAGGIVALDDPLVATCGIRSRELARHVEDAADAVAREDEAYRRARAPLDISGRTVVIVDDGANTGATMRAAIAAARARGAAHVVRALPVASTRTCAGVDGPPDDSVACVTRDPAYAIGLFYDHFPPATDADVLDALAPKATNTPTSRA